MVFFDQVQRWAQDPTIVITTYRGEHNNFLSLLAIPEIDLSSNQFISEGMNRENCIANNEFIPYTSIISILSTFPTIALEITKNCLNPPGLQLAIKNFQHDFRYHNKLHNYISIM